MWFSWISLESSFTLWLSDSLSPKVRVFSSPASEVGDIAVWSHELTHTLTNISDYVLLRIKIGNELYHNLKQYGTDIKDKAYMAYVYWIIVKIMENKTYLLKAKYY